MQQLSLDDLKKEFDSIESTIQPMELRILYKKYFETIPHARQVHILLLKLIKYRTLHKAMWQWLADNPTSKKGDWPGWIESGYASHQCFACHVCGVRCSICPLDWPQGKDCSEMDGLYKQWSRAETPEEASLAALAIKNVPWKFEKSVDMR